MCQQVEAAEEMNIGRDCNKFMSLIASFFCVHNIIVVGLHKPGKNEVNFSDMR